MKKLIKTLGFSFTCLMMFFQQAHSQFVLEQKIDSLNERSFELRASDQNVSMALARQAISLSSEKYSKGLMNARLNLGMSYALLNQTDSSLFFLKTVESHFEKDVFKTGLIKYYLALNYSFLRDFNSALGYLDEAQELFVQSKSFEYQAEVQNSKGVIQARQGNRDEALAYFSNAYEIKLKNGLRYDTELTNIAIIYRMLKKYDKALEFANKSLTTCKVHRDSLGIVQTLITIGNIYAGAKQLDSAEYYYDKAFDLATTNKYAKQAVSALQNKSMVAERSGHLEKAISIQKKVVSISQEEDHVWEKTFYGMARAFVKLGKPDSAIHFAKKSYALSRKYHDPDMASQGAKLLSDNYEKVQQLDSSLACLRLYTIHEDTLKHRNSQSELSDLRVRIETLEQENQIDQLQREKELEQLQKSWLTAAIIAIVIIGCLAVLLLVLRHRNKIKITELEQQKLLQTINHAQGELYQQTLHMIHVNNCLNDIEKQVVKVKRARPEYTNELSQILSSIRVNKSLDKDWENFHKYFGKVHSEFIQKIASGSYGLSNHEQRVCTLLKLGLSNHEVATILNIQVKSVTMLRYRIKKKLRLEKDQDLSDYLSQF